MYSYSKQQLSHPACIEHEELKKTATISYHFYLILVTCRPNDLIRKPAVSSHDTESRHCFT